MSDEINDEVQAAYTEKKFRAFAIANPEVFHLFCRYARIAKNAGHERLSIWLLANRVRWETEIVTQGDRHKIPNGALAYYARLMMRRAEFAGFFECRPLRAGEPDWSPLYKET